MYIEICQNNKFNFLFFFFCSGRKSTTETLNCRHKLLNVCFDTITKNCQKKAKKRNVKKICILFNWNDILKIHYSVRKIQIFLICFTLVTTINKTQSSWKMCVCFFFWWFFFMRTCLFWIVKISDIAFKLKIVHRVVIIFVRFEFQGEVETKHIFYWSAKFEKKKINMININQNVNVIFF